MPRTATIQRETKETQIELTLNLDGQGHSDVSTGVGFLDHVLELFARHGLMDLTVKATGDLHVEAHHTVEDVGICLGKAITQAVGDKKGIRRYGHFTLPMDETLVTVAVDLGGRPHFAWNAEVQYELLGNFGSPLAEEHWQAVTNNALMNYHVILHYGRNVHHIIEAIFKASARAIRMAIENDPRNSDVPSTKGTLTE